MKKYKISDIAVFEREWSEEKLLVLSENDHLLRRFGQIVLYKFKVDEISKEYLNETED